jgi:hypothetical protein
MGFGFVGQLIEADRVPQVHVLTEDILDDCGKLVGKRTRWFVERATIEQYLDGRFEVEKVSGEPIEVRNGS